MPRIPHNLRRKGRSCAKEVQSGSNSKSEFTFFAIKVSLEKASF